MSGLDSTPVSPPGWGRWTESLQGEGPSGPRAGWWRRFAALSIDCLLVGALNMVVTMPLGPSAALLVATVVSMAYFAYFEGGRTGQTVGKKALGIRVVDARTAQPIGFGRGVVRYIASIVSTIPLFLGYVWMLWDREGQCWHDKLAKDYVVPAKTYPVR